MHWTFSKTLGAALAAVCWIASPLAANEKDQAETDALRESIRATAQELSAELEAAKLEDKVFMRKLVGQLIKSYGVQNRFLVAEAAVALYPAQSQLVAKEILRHSPVDAGRLGDLFGQRNVQTALTNAGLASSILRSDTAASSARSFSIPPLEDRRRVASMISGGVNTIARDTTPPGYTQGNLNMGNIGAGTFTAVKSAPFGVGQVYAVSWSGGPPSQTTGSNQAFTLESISGNVHTFTRPGMGATITKFVVTLN